MKLCKHSDYRKIDWIKAPRYWDKKVLIDVDAAKGKEHLLIRFTDKSPKEKYGWFYMSGKEVRRYGTQPNGRIMVHVVPMTKMQTFTPDKDCKCMNEELDLFK